MSDRAKKYLTETALTVGALAGVLCVLVAIVSVVGGFSPLVVRSGSMSPTIGVGDIAVARTVPADDVHVGDIVSVTRADGARVTHRVAQIQTRVGNSTTMTLHGDANRVPDAEPYTVTTVDRVAFHVPKLGYVLTWFATPYVWALTTLVVLALLWIAFRPDRSWRQSQRGRHSTAPRRSRSISIAMQVTAVAVVVASAVAGYSRTSGTLAALTDSATATGTVSAGRPTAPASLSCATVSTGLLSSAAQLSWPNPTASHGYDYQLTFTPSLLGTTRVVTVAVSTTNPATLQVSSDYVTTILGLSVLGIYTVELRSKVGNFTSSGSVSIKLNVLLDSVTCGSSAGTVSAATATRQAARAAVPSTTSTSTTATPSIAQAATSETTPPTAAPTTSAAPDTTTTTSTSEAPTTSAAPTTEETPVPVGTLSPGGDYRASATDGVVVIRNVATGTAEYQGSGSTVEWTGTSTLRVTAADGSTTDLTRSGGTWAVATPVVTETTPAG
ncbi:signal peptidase I [Williamsia sterculiae]|uniref:Signal peptidase I n=1 Tax=Williamsia sterculiae TaxID=1344003 RepID=A0A1N7HBA0_9NOCA|nr:signal peptidase I [Williamsia sterculiae]SIS21958.1 signal peptidase I [Williamsia sterculiae]